MAVASYLHLFLALALAPLLPGVIARTKAFFAGRTGAPLLQPYYDLARLFGKGAVYSRTTTDVFRAGPVVGLAALLVAAAFVPAGGTPAAVAFEGDFLLVAYLLALARFATVLAALDTGSSFEGMGASREVQFSALAEPALLVGLAALARETGRLSLSGMYGALGPVAAAPGAFALVLVAGALVVVFLAENARIPVDDPNTHLELTMIHEVMVLDHGGPDFGFIQYAAALKLWLMGSLVTGLAVPLRGGGPWRDGILFVCGMLALAIGVGVVESVMARLRLVRVPQLLIGACALSALALALVMKH